MKWIRHEKGLGPQENDAALLLVCEINNKNDKRGNSMFGNNTGRERKDSSFLRGAPGIFPIVFKITKDQANCEGCISAGLGDR
jgi:hypothetical protein